MLFFTVAAWAGVTMQVEPSLTTPAEVVMVRSARDR